jgi:hypothetical protein
VRVVCSLAPFTWNQTKHPQPLAGIDEQKLVVVRQAVQFLQSHHSCLESGSRVETMLRKAREEAELQEHRRLLEAHVFAKLGPAAVNGGFRSPVRSWSNSTLEGRSPTDTRSWNSDFSGMWSGDASD